ncbi:gamma-glutamyltranspeptidase/glutathione hydrolase [Deinobacterium chartae]|uniref:Gamma-glutamyltranspeptidase/glutathione hydrolase n=1 Tax=Deinobacterium chartae TaxID=521158 RepID=A0A841I7F5_9DEIO|nr:gamma-glutamyltransferase family protein [Deinobacterium chartae]MBB6099802.1 gamma-glutamyltranspeptidase/glutathione hydrolase [Deinobacterium chartae]
MHISPYASSRQPIYARRGIVATSQPLAAQAGLAILRAGGNAVDAAVATAAALTVLEPTSNGIGGDAFALVWDGSELHGLNASGRSPQGLTRAALEAHSVSELPTAGWLPVTVPGAPRAWADLIARFGRLSLEQVLAPAVEYARDGYPLSPVLAHYWNRAARAFASRQGPEFAGWNETFLPQGFQPEAGAIWASEGHARTLEAIGRSGAEAFYSGELADRIDAFARATGGLIRKEDLEAHVSEWVKPISVSYKGYEVHEIPPNGQGIAALMALRVLEGLELPRHRDSAEGLHLQIEAMKLAFADAHAFVADPAHVHVPTEALLSDAYAASRRALIGERAAQPAPGEPPRGGTVYLCAADESGMMISLIQSNYMGFGSGVVVPGTGIALQNRGHNFSLEAGHPNELAPGKRPYHTIIPGFLTRGGRAVGPFGVMGGFMQPQGHVQVVLNTVDYGMNPQVALDAPRWQWMRGLEVELEHHTPRHVALELAERGHNVRVMADSGSFGRGQAIWKLDSGALVAGSDGRTDGQAAGY